MAITAARRVVQRTLYKYDFEWKRVSEWGEKRNREDEKMVDVYLPADWMIRGISDVGNGTGETEAMVYIYFFATQSARK